MHIRKNQQKEKLKNIKEKIEPKMKMWKTPSVQLHTKQPSISRQIKPQVNMLRKEDYFAIDNKPTVLWAVVPRDSIQSENFPITTHFLVLFRKLKEGTNGYIRWVCLKIRNTTVQSVGLAGKLCKVTERERERERAVSHTPHGIWTRWAGNSIQLKFGGG